MADVDFGTIGGTVELEDRFSDILDKLEKGVERVANAVDNVDKTLKAHDAGMATWVKALGATATAAVAGATALIGYGAAIVKFGEHGAKIIGVENAFNRLSKAIGQTGEVLLGKLQEGVHDTIDSMELMTIANRALSAGVKLTGEDMKQLGEAARGMGKAAGTSAAQELETLFRALTSGSTRLLKMKGFTIDLVAAEKKFRDEHNLGTEALNARGKVEVQRIAFLDAVVKRNQLLGQSEEDLKEKVQKLEVVMSDWWEGLYKAVAQSPVVLKAFDSISKSVLGLIKDLGPAVIDTIMGGVNAFAEGIASFAPMIATAAAKVREFWQTIVELNERFEVTDKIITAVKASFGFLRDAVMLVVEWAVKFWNRLVEINDRFDITGKMTALAVQAFNFLRGAFLLVEEAAKKVMAAWESMPKWLQDIAAQAITAGLALGAVNLAVGAMASPMSALIGKVDQFTNIWGNLAGALFQTPLVFRSLNKALTESQLAIRVWGALVAVTGPGIALLRAEVFALTATEVGGTVAITLWNRAMVFLGESLTLVRTGIIALITRLGLLSTAEVAQANAVGVATKAQALWAAGSAIIIKHYEGLLVRTGLLTTADLALADATEAAIIPTMTLSAAIKGLIAFYISATLVATGITAVIVALGYALFQSGKAFIGWLAAVKKGEGIKFLSAKDDQNFLRRWTGLAEAITPLRQAIDDLAEAQAHLDEVMEARKSAGLFDDLATILKHEVVSAAQTASSYILAFAKNVKDSIGWAASGFAKGWENAGLIISAVWITLIAKATAFAKNVKDSIGWAASKFAEGWETAGLVVSAVWSAITEKVTAFAQRLKDSIGWAASNFATGWENAGLITSAVWDVITQKAAAFAEGIKNTIGWTASNFAAGWENAGLVISAVLATIKENVQAWVKGFEAKINIALYVADEMWNGVRSTVMGWIASFSPNINVVLYLADEMLNGIRDKVMAWVGDFKATINVVLYLANEMWNEARDKVIAWVDSFKPTINIVLYLANEMWNGIRDTVMGWVGDFKPTINVLLYFANEMWNDVRDRVLARVASFKPNINIALYVANEMWSSIRDQVKAWIAGFTPSITIGLKLSVFGAGLDPKALDPHAEKWRDQIAETAKAIREADTTGLTAAQHAVDSAKKRVKAEQDVAEAIYKSTDEYKRQMRELTGERIANEINNLKIMYADLVATGKNSAEALMRLGGTLSGIRKTMLADSGGKQTGLNAVQNALADVFDRVGASAGVAAEAVSGFTKENKAGTDAALKAAAAFQKQAEQMDKFAGRDTLEKGINLTNLMSGADMSTLPVSTLEDLNSTLTETIQLMERKNLPLYPEMLKLRDAAKVALDAMVEAKESIQRQLDALDAFMAKAAAIQAEVDKLKNARPADTGMAAANVFLITLAQIAPELDAATSSFEDLDAAVGNMNLGEAQKWFTQVEASLTTLREMGGIATEELAMATAAAMPLGISLVAIFKELPKPLVDSERALKDFFDRFADVKAGADHAVESLAAFDVKSAAVAADIAKLANVDVFKEGEYALKIFLETLHRFAPELDITTASQKELNAALKLMNLDQAKAELAKITAEIKALKNANSPISAELKKSHDALKNFVDGEKDVKTLTQSLNDLSRAFSELANITGGSLGETFKEIGTVISAASLGGQGGESMRSGFTQFHKGFDQIGTDGKEAFGNIAAGAASMAAGAISAFAAMSAATSGWTKKSRVLGGALAGATIGNEIAGPYGALAGLVIGAIIGAIRKNKAAEVLASIGKEYGHVFSKALATAIADDVKNKVAKSFDASKLLHLGDIIKEVGGINALNFDQFARKLRDVFSMVQTGEMSIAQATKVLSEVFPQLAAQVLESGHIASLQFLELISLTTQLGIKSKEVMDWMTSQMQRASTAAMAVFADMGKGYEGLGDEIAASQKVVTDAINKAPGVASTSKKLDDLLKKQQTNAKKYADAVIEAQKRVDEALASGKGLKDAQAHLEEAKKRQLENSKTIADQIMAQQKRVDDALKKGAGSRDAVEAQKKLNDLLAKQKKGAAEAAEEFSRMQTIILATFNSGRAAGMTFLQALATVSGSLAQLAALQHNLGIEADNPAIKQLIIAGEVAETSAGKAAAGLAELGLALSNIPKGMNIDSFTAIEGQIGTVFGRVSAEVAKFGGTADDALLQMVPSLQVIIDAAAQYGWTIDDNTQKLIDQATASGLMTGKATKDVKTVSEQMTDTNNVLLLGIGALVEAVGGTLPQAFKDMRDKAIKDMDDLKAHTPDIVIDPKFGPLPPFPEIPAPPTVHVQTKYDAPTGYTPGSGPPSGGDPNRQYALGGLVYAAGGFSVPRGTDTIPAMLSPGEYVVNASAVAKLGPEVMSQIGMGKIPGGGVMTTTGKANEAFGQIATASHATAGKVTTDFDSLGATFADAVQQVTKDLGSLDDAGTATFTGLVGMIEKVTERIVPLSEKLQILIGLLKVIPSVPASETPPALPEKPGAPSVPGIPVLNELPIPHSPSVGFAPGFAVGGLIGAQRVVYASSGWQARGTDTVPAMLTPGEFVMRKSAVDAVGVPTLAAMNSGSMGRGDEKQAIMSALETAMKSAGVSIVVLQSADNPSKDVERLIKVLPAITRNKQGLQTGLLEALRLRK